MRSEPFLRSYWQKIASGGEVIFFSALATGVWLQMISEGLKDMIEDNRLE